MKTMRFGLILSLALLPILGMAKSTAITIGDTVLEPGDSFFFSLEEMAEEIGGLPVMDEYLPDGIEVEWTGKRFKTPKAGKVKYSKKEEDFITTSDENPCGFKMSINKKKGKVSGSFKVYVQKSEKKVKSYTAKVSGYVGSELVVTVKKVGTFEATLD